MSQWLEDSGTMNDVRPYSRFSYSFALRVLVGVAILFVVLWCGQYFGHKISGIEQWIADLGFWAPLVFLLLVVVCTSLFLPDTLFAALAGAAFGMLQGSIIMVIAVLVTASLNFWVSRHLLSDKVRTFLNNHPRLHAIEKAANQQGMRLLVLLRVSPISAVSLNYALGASRVTFGSYFVSCFAMIPMVIVEVYFGYFATHLSKTTSKAHSLSSLHTTMLAAGFAICVVIMLYITQLARHALADLSDVNPDP